MYTVLPESALLDAHAALLAHLVPRSLLVLCMQVTIELAVKGSVLAASEVKQKKEMTKLSRPYGTPRIDLESS